MAAHAEPEIILYDLACIKNECFSPAVWKIRMLLNYKQIRYKTVFLEFPDIAPTLLGLYVSLLLLFPSLHEKSLPTKPAAFPFPRAKPNTPSQQFIISPPKHTSWTPPPSPSSSLPSTPRRQ